MTNKILGFFIAFLPLYLRVTETENNRPSKDFLFYSVASAIVIIAGKQIRFLGKYSKAVLLYAVFMSAYLPDHVFSSNVMVHTISMLFGMVFFVKYFETCDDNIEPLYKGMMVGALIQGTIGVCGYFGVEPYHRLMDVMESHLDFYYSVAQGRYTFDWVFSDVRATSVGGGPGNVVGSLGNCNLLACYLSLTLPAFLTTKRKLEILGAAIPLTALFLSESYMSILSLMAGGVYYLNFRYSRSGYGILPKISFYLGAIAAMLTLPLLNLNIDSGRFYAWKKMLTGIPLDHWLIGKGPGWYADQKLILADGYTALIQEHSVFLTVFNAFGVAGFLLLTPIVYKFMKVKDNNLIMSSILFIAFCGSYGHFMIQQSTAVLIMIPVLCLCLKEIKT